MMRLALMREYYETVDEDGHSLIADLIARRWLDSVGIVTNYRASANFICQIETPDAAYFLRFNHAAERQVPAILAELEFINHLACEGVRVAKPVVSIAGKLVETVPTEMGDFHAAMFQDLHGIQLELPELGEKGYVIWGEALGKLHRASHGHTVAGRPSWSDHIARARQLIPPAEEHALKELQFIEDRLSVLPVNPGEYGLIHYDFELDNIAWDGTDIGILDFDDCAGYWYEADIAYALRELYEDRADKVDLTDNLLNAFLTGYRYVRPLESYAVERIPLFARLHNLVSFARLLRSLGDLPQDYEPDWLEQLRAKLAAYASAYRTAFQECPASVILK